MNSDPFTEERERVLAVLESGRYNKGILPELCNCLDSQVQNGWYDCEINLAILKLYQFYPDANTVNPEVMIRVLIKAMMNLPEADFHLAMYLIPEPFHSSEEVEHLVYLVEKLEMGQFKEFWRMFKERSQVFTLFPKFEKIIRSFILETLSLTYSLIPSTILCECLNVKDSDLDLLFTKQAREGVCIKLDENLENQPKPTTYEKESDIQLNHVSALMTNLMR